MSNNSHVLAAQWSSRPMDQRFLSMADLHAFNVAKQQRSAERGVELNQVKLSALPDNTVGIAAKDGAPPAELTHWAFGQLASRAGAPAAYLRTLPASMAIVPLQYSLSLKTSGENSDNGAKVLLRKNGHWTADAITSPTYGRIFDASLSGAIIKGVDLNIWKVPKASYAAKDPLRATTLYASDRDMFLCLVDDSHPIEVPGANGADTLFRGFIVRHSEVGAYAYDFLAFLYRRICDNRIIWGMNKLAKLRFKHTSGAPQRFLREAAPALKGYLNAPASELESSIKMARTKTLGATDDEVVTLLRGKGFTEALARSAITEAATEPGLDPRSAWGVAQGLTRVAQDLPYGDERFDAERKAGKLLDTLTM